jgi:hypothetical protein
MGEHWGNRWLFAAHPQNLGSMPPIPCLSRHFGTTRHSVKLPEQAQREPSKLEVAGSSPVSRSYELPVKAGLSVPPFAGPLGLWCTAGENPVGADTAFVDSSNDANHASFRFAEMAPSSPHRHVGPRFLSPRAPQPPALPLGRLCYALRDPNSEFCLSRLPGGYTADCGIRVCGILGLAPPLEAVPLDKLDRRQKCCALVSVRQRVVAGEMPEQDGRFEDELRVRLDPAEARLRCMKRGVGELDPIKSGEGLRRHPTHFLGDQQIIDQVEVVPGHALFGEAFENVLVLLEGLAEPLLERFVLSPSLNMSFDGVANGVAHRHLVDLGNSLEFLGLVDR